MAQKKAVQQKMMHGQIPKRLKSQTDHSDYQESFLNYHYETISISSN